MTAIIIREPMNFNVHRRNKSLAAEFSQRDKREPRSLKKMQSPAPIENLLAQAKELYQSQGDLAEAARLFSQYLAHNPWSSEALYLCAVCELKVGRLAEALAHLAAIPDDYAHKANSLLLQAMALNKLGNTSQSLQLANQCVRRYEHFEEAICFRGKLLMAMSYYHRAEQDFKTLIARPACSFLPHNSLGDCYRSQGNPEKALPPYLKALELLSALQHSTTQGLQKELYLKIGICLYELQRWKEAKSYLQEAGKLEQNMGCEFHYYCGSTLIKLEDKEKGMLHLQYCLRTQGSRKLMRKAYKKLIQLYLQNYQYYEALNTVRLGDIVGLQLQGWSKVVSAFMLIIKGSFEDALTTLSQICQQLKADDPHTRLHNIKHNIKPDTSHRNPTHDARYHQSFNHKRPCEKKLFAGSPKIHSKDKQSRNRSSNGKMRHFSTKSVLRAVPKIESMRAHEKSGGLLKREQQTRVRREHAQQEKKELYSSKQKEFMFPLVLQFKAYAEFFLSQYMQCLDSYEEYEAFIKDVFGRDSDVVYNKTLCEGLLMGESDLQEEALNKYSACVDSYYQKNGSIPLQPLLYKIVLLVRLALEQPNEQLAQEQSNEQLAQEESNEQLALEQPNEQQLAKAEQQATYNEILESTIQMMDNYQAVLGSSSLALYFRGLVCLLLGRLQECREWLEKALKIAEDCSWRCLWVKGVVEMRLGNYYEAVKEFSAGLILENRAELYLGRSISFLLLSEEAQRAPLTQQPHTLMRSVHLGEHQHPQNHPQDLSEARKKSDALIQNCFQDLQKYIQLQTSQQQISVWVSKILFRNKAYDEAIRSLRKIREHSQEVTAMIHSVEIYEGNFDCAGQLGQVIKAAFEGCFLSRAEEEALLHADAPLRQLHSLQKGGLQKGGLQKGFAKWLATVHLYVTQNYALMLKYLQKELFSQQDSKVALMLRYNIIMAYLLLGQHKKAVNACKTLLHAAHNPTIARIMHKIQTLSFDQDECLQDLKEELNLSCSKLLSHYLPYRSVHLDQQAAKTVYVRPSIPFPEFVVPSMQLTVGQKLVAAEIVSTAVEKKLEAPWIRKTGKRTVQFMEKLEESGVYLTGETTSVKEEPSDPFLI